MRDELLLGGEAAQIRAIGARVESALFANHHLDRLHPNCVDRHQIRPCNPVMCFQLLHQQSLVYRLFTTLFDRPGLLAYSDDVNMRFRGDVNNF